MDGIQSPFVYVGGPLTSFGLHLEDGNLNSINFLHRGFPKIWYILTLYHTSLSFTFFVVYLKFTCFIMLHRYFVPSEHNLKLESLVAKITKTIDCDLYIRHKNLMIPPSVLRKNDIKFARVS